MPASDPNDARSVDLFPDDHVIESDAAVERFKCPATVLDHGLGIIADMKAEVEGVERWKAGAAGALREGAGSRQPRSDRGRASRGLNSRYGQPHLITIGL